MLPLLFLQKITLVDLLELKPQGCVNPRLTQPSASQVSDSREADPLNLRPQTEPGDEKK